MIHSKRRQQGNILISVLWVLVAMAILVMGLSYEARSDIERTMLHRDRARAYWLARAAVERVKYEYATTQVNRADPDPENRPQVRYNLQFADGWAECLIMTNSSKMSVNSKNRDQWLQLFKLYGLDDQQLDEIADAILDWQDQDELMRLNGAESEYYQSLSPAYRAHNGPFFSVEEIALVRGVTEDMFYGSTVEGVTVPGLKDLLAISGQNQARFDINTCPEGILMAFLEIDQDGARNIIARREEQMIENIQDIASEIATDIPENLNRFFMAQRAGSNAFTIRSTGYVTGSPARYTVEDEVRYIGGARLYTNVSHKDFSLDHVDETMLEEEIQ